MSSPDELKAAVSACKSVAGIPVIASMTFLLGEKGYRTMMGVSIKEAISAMLAANCDVVGANCGLGIQQMVQIMQEARAISKTITDKNVLLIAQPNAGMPKFINSKTIFTESASDFAKSIPELIKLGVNIIGGCCGTTPEHIKEIAKIVNENN